MMAYIHLNESFNCQNIYDKVKNVNVENEQALVAEEDDDCKKEHNHCNKVPKFCQNTSNVTSLNSNLNKHETNRPGEVSVVTSRTDVDCLKHINEPEKTHLLTATSSKLRNYYDNDLDTIWGHSLNVDNKKETKFSKSVKFKRLKKQGRNRKGGFQNRKLSDFNTYSDRKKSFQLSSIRVHETLKRKSKKSRQHNLEYGHRMILRNGNPNIQKHENRVELYGRYFSDIFTTLLDSSWSMVLAITIIVYFGHWLIFGLFYWTFLAINGDNVLYSELHSSEAENSSAVFEENPKVCVYNVYDFKTAFLFSLESETSIGYGSRTISTHCPPAIICLILQCIVSAIFDTWVIGMCFARLARPDARSMTTLFSKNAVVCQRDGKRCLLVRFSNLRKSLLLNVTFKGILITWREAERKEKADGFQRMLIQTIVKFSNESSALLTAPIDYCHVIDKHSPLYDFAPDQYNSVDGKNYFELVCIATGTLESTGLTMQAQTSYLSSEVFYGYRFFPTVFKCPEKKRFAVDFQNFHKVWPEPPWIISKKINTSGVHVVVEDAREEVLRDKNFSSKFPTSNSNQVEAESVV